MILRHATEPDRDCNSYTSVAAAMFAAALCNVTSNVK